MQRLICSAAILQSYDKESSTHDLELSSSAVFVMVLQMVFLFVSCFKLSVCANTSLFPIKAFWYYYQQGVQIVNSRAKMRMVTRKCWHDAVSCAFG